MPLNIKTLTLVDTLYCDYSMSSIVCAVSSLPLARFCAELFTPTEGYTRHGTYHALMT